MRLRFLGVPRLSKTSPGVDLTAAAAACKEELDENVQVKTVSQPMTRAADVVASVRQLRQRRVGVGLWAIRRQKLERAQLRPRLVVRMSRLRGRRTARDFGAGNLCKKVKPSQSSAANVPPLVITADGSTSQETGDGTTNVNRDTIVDVKNEFEPEKLHQNNAGDNVGNHQMKADENEDRKLSSDSVNSRPKRHIMQKKIVSAFVILH